MLKTLKGLAMTFTLSPKLLLYESIRRLTKRPYRYRGILIRNEADFRTIRGALKKNIGIWSNGEQVYFETKFGILSVPLPRLAYSIIEEMGYYDSLRVRDKIVLDVGAYIGDTALFFVSRGARKVYAYEPVFYKIAKKH